IVYPVNMPPFFSSDAGITWKEAKVDELPSGDDLVYTLEKVGENVIVATNATYQKDLYVSKNDGLSYQRLASLKAQYGQTILDWCQDRGILYALGHDAQLYQSMDIGATWNPIGTILLKDSFGISFSKDYNLHFFIRDSSVFYFNRRGLITSEKWGMLVSNDLGTHWQFYDLKTALLPWGNNPFLYLVSVGASLIAASPVGVFRSDDKGQSWYNWSEGLGKRKVIEFQVYDGYLWAAVQSNGIWKRPLGSVSANEVSFRNTTSWALFPNPLAPGQSLTILTQTEGAYRVRLFDATGKVVVEKNLEGTTRLDNLNLPSGVYGYEILSDAQRVTGKLVVGR
ncbi:MAG TPA: T9SS type A sorting domain-containing protein, partial [Cellvibrionaceae bacterium]|nr:T9SS type A sorting domain-containing protein [Cellvibrionaceae bacterium]